jgi:hypothetical protein
MAADPYGNGTVVAGFPLIHDIGGQQMMQPENVIVGYPAFRRAFFHVSQSGEIILDFPVLQWLRLACIPAFLQGANLFQGQGIPLDGGGSMDVTGAGIPLQDRDPRKGGDGHPDPFPQRGDFLGFRQQSGPDSELGNIGHDSKDDY